MSKTKQLLLAGASSLLLAAFAIPAIAQDAEQGAGAVDFLKDLQNHADQATPASEVPAEAAHPETPAAGAPEASPAEAEAPISADPSDNTQADGAQSGDTTPEDTSSGDVTSAPEMADPVADAPTSDDSAADTSTVQDPALLDQISKLQGEIIVKKLQLEKETVQHDLDKLTGEAEIKAAQAAAALNPQPQLQEPEDDTSKLPGVSAIIGAAGMKKVELALAGSGTVTAKVGDTLPGGWKLSKIDGSAVYVTSTRTNAEFVLGPSSAPESGSRISSPVTTAPAPKAEKSTSEQSGETLSGGSKGIVLAPAN